MTDIPSNTPETLLSDPDSMAFFILRDESIAVAKKRTDLPYGKNDAKYRNTYLSSGRFSPEHKKVIFYPDPVNPSRAMELLREEMHVDETYSFQIQDGPAQNKAPDPSNNLFEHLKGVRKRGAEVLVEKGLKVQKSGSQNSISKKN